jgi:hypothetical protein
VGAFIDSDPRASVECILKCVPQRVLVRGTGQVAGNWGSIGVASGWIGAEEQDRRSFDMPAPGLGHPPLSQRTVVLEIHDLLARRRLSAEYGSNHWTPSDFEGKSAGVMAHAARELCGFSMTPTMDFVDVHGEIGSIG